MSQEEESKVSYQDTVTYIGDGASKVAVARSAESLNKILDDARLLDGKKTTEQLASESKGA